MFWHKIFGNKKSNYSGRSKQDGFTFLEIAISLFVLTLGALSMLQIVNVAMEANYRAQQDVIASNLAAALLSEIISKPFLGENTVIGPDGFEVRTDLPPGTLSFDDVDDYNNYNDAPPASVDNVVMNGAGGAVNYQGFSRAVTVIYVDENNVSTGGAVSNYKRITVTVTDPRGNNFELPTVRSLSAG